MEDHLARNKFPSPVDRDSVADNWRARGYSCGLFVDLPGQQWLDFVHDSNELVTVLEGRLEMRIGDQRFVMEPGDEVIIPRDAVHSVINAHDGVTKWLYGYD